MWKEFQKIQPTAINIKTTTSPVAEFHNLTAAHLGTGEPCQDIIEKLEDLLARAKRGEIIGITCAGVEANNSIFDWFASGCADKSFMMLAVHSLHTRITRGWYDLVMEERQG